MKTMKKLFALLLALTMVFGLAATGFAAVSYTITVTNNHENVTIANKTYTAYKIFDVNYKANEDGTPVDVNGNYSYTMAPAFANWHYKAADGTEYWGDETMSDRSTPLSLVKYIESLSKDSPELFHFANAALAQAQTNGSTGYTGTVAENAETTTIDVTAGGAGYYLVMGDAKADEGSSDSDNLTAAVSLTTTNPTATVNPKVDAPKIDKKFDTTDTSTPDSDKGTAEDVGDTVKFKLTSKVPDMNGFSKYVYIVHDTLSTGLTFQNDVAITVGSKTLVNPTDFTVEEENGDLTITFVNFIQYKEVKGADITITYTAVINENAKSTDVENNSASIEYSSNPRDEDDHETTPPSKVYVYDFEIVINKYAEQTDKEDKSQKLAGAEFVLKNDQNAYYYWNDTTKKVEWYALEGEETLEQLVAGEIENKHVTVAVTGTDGAVRFEGLDAGTYNLTEIKAPAGYNLLDKDVPVTIEATFNTDGSLASTNTTKEDDAYSYTVDVPNNTGNLLPETGGMGTTLFYVVGSVLMIGAAVLLVTKKRTNI